MTCLTTQETEAAASRVIYLGWCLPCQHSSVWGSRESMGSGCEKVLLLRTAEAGPPRLHTAHPGSALQAQWTPQERERRLACAYLSLTTS